MSNVAGSKKGVYGIKIDKDQFERLCSIMCSVDEICGFFGVSYDTLKRFCKQTYNQNFEVVQKDKSALGKISLRRIQFKQAERYPAMAIFLGKQYLGQTDESGMPNNNVQLISVQVIDAEQYKSKIEQIENQIVKPLAIKEPNN